MKYIILSLMIFGSFQAFSEDCTTINYQECEAGSWKNSSLSWNELSDDVRVMLQNHEILTRSLLGEISQHKIDDSARLALVILQKEKEDITRQLASFKGYLLGEVLVTRLLEEGSQYYKIDSWWDKSWWDKSDDFAHLILVRLQKEKEDITRQLEIVKGYLSGEVSQHEFVTGYLLHEILTRYLLGEISQHKIDAFAHLALVILRKEKEDITRQLEIVKGYLSGEVLVTRLLEEGSQYYKIDSWWNTWWTWWDNSDDYALLIFVRLHKEKQDIARQLEIVKGYLSGEVSQHEFVTGYLLMKETKSI